MKKIKLVPSFALLTLATPVISSCGCISPTITTKIDTTKSGNVFVTSQHSINQNWQYQYTGVKTTSDNNTTITINVSAKSYQINIESINIKINGKDLEEASSNSSVTKAYKIPSGTKENTEIEILIKYSTSVISGAVVIFTLA